MTCQRKWYGTFVIDNFGISKCYQPNSYTMYSMQNNGTQSIRSYDDKIYKQCELAEVLNNTVIKYLENSLKTWLLKWKVLSLHGIYWFFERRQMFVSFEICSIISLFFYWCKKKLDFIGWSIHSVRMLVINCSLVAASKNKRILHSKSKIWFDF